MIELERTSRTTSPTPPRAAQPFNRRLLAQGRDALPAGGLHGDHRRHFVTQERIGAFLILLIFFGVAYGVTREFLRPALVIGGVALVIAWLPGRRGRRLRARRRRVRWQADDPRQ